MPSSIAAGLLDPELGAFERISVGAGFKPALFQTRPVNSPRQQNSPRQRAIALFQTHPYRINIASPKEKKR